MKDREDKVYLSVLEKQLKESMPDISDRKLEFKDKIILAYEPIWAIGSGNTASKTDIEEVHTHLKKIINTNYQFNFDIPILYGGSVNSKNSTEICKINNVDGLLIGGASLNSKDFLQIINNSI